MKPEAPEQFRVTAKSVERMKLSPALASDESFGRNGAFFVPYYRDVLRCIISDQGGWEHVSVSLPTRCPSWEEMCFIKDLFWDEDECVVQFHPPKSEYVNRHPFCLHLWRKVGCSIETPPKEFVG